LNAYDTEQHPPGGLDGDVAIQMTKPSSRQNAKWN
jgi:hypothetical protein